MLPADGSKYQHFPIVSRVLEGDEMRVKGMWGNCQKIALIFAMAASHVGAVCNHPINYQPAPHAFIFDTEATLEHPYIRGQGNSSIELTPLGIVLTDEQAIAQTNGEFGRRAGIIKLFLLGHYALDDFFREDAERLCNKTPTEVDALGSKLLEQLLGRLKLTRTQLEQNDHMIAALAREIGNKILSGVGYQEEDIEKLRELADKQKPVPRTYEELHVLALNGFLGNLFDRMAMHFKSLLN